MSVEELEALNSGLDCDHAPLNQSTVCLRRTLSESHARRKEYLRSHVQRDRIPAYVHEDGCADDDELRCVRGTVGDQRRAAPVVQPRAEQRLQQPQCWRDCE